MAKKSNEEIQREILETQLEQSKISLEQTRESNASYRQRRDVAAKTNANRQRQFAMDRANLRHIQRVKCQHMAGGDAGESPLEGGGKFAFSILAVTIMPDGITELIQCARCRLMLYGRKLNPQEEARLRAAAEKAEEKNPETFASDPAWQKWDDHVWFKELKVTHRKEGLKHSVMRGPTFKFEDAKTGVPVIPDVTGYATSGAGGR